jgi:hypothetical protein
MRAIATTGQKKASIGVWRQDYVWGYLPSKWIPPQKNKKDGRVIHKTAANVAGKINICMQKTNTRSMSFTLHEYQLKVDLGP